MNMRQAEYILAVLQEGGISAAAQKLYISQPALSQSIKNIEVELNAQIFLRGTSPLRLTYAGEKVAEIARQYIMLDLNLKNIIADINKEVSGTFRFGTSKGIGDTLLPKLVPSYIREYPQVDLKILELGSQDIEKKILDHTLDAGLVRAYQLKPNLKYILVEEDSLVLIVGRNSSFARAHPDDVEVEFAELENQRFIAKRRGNRSRFLLDQLCNIYQITPQIPFEFNQFYTSVQTAIACDCVLISSLTTLKRNPDLMRRAMTYRLKNVNISHNIYLCYHEELYLTKYMWKWFELTKQYFYSELISL